jgi:hypothetical protein
MRSDNRRKEEKKISGAKVQIQGCQMVYFQTKNTNLGKIWGALEWKMLLYLMTIWNIFWSFYIIYCPLV